MLEAQKIKRLLITLLKGSPILIICLLIGLFVTRKAIQYSTPQFQSIAKIKLDDYRYGMSSNNLYDDFDVFTSENKIETEAEILQSPLLIGQTLDKINYKSKIWRKGKLKNKLLYRDNPFIISVDSNFSSFDQKFILKIDNNNAYIILNEETKTFVAKGLLEKTTAIGNEDFRIDLNYEVLKNKELDIVGNYVLLIPSRESLISSIQKDLNVKAVDKEIAILRVVFKSEDAQFAADFTNALCDTYVEDYIKTKSLAAKKTLNFIDDRMNDINKNLVQSENELERYKMNHQVVNTLQETETGLREISKLRLQLIILETEEKATRELEQYISSGDFYDYTSINFGFGDLVLTELVKKLKIHSDKKKDLLLKYTEQDKRVISTQDKIDDIEVYIKEAIHRNLTDFKIRREEIQNSLNELEKQFKHIPTREKEMHALQREFLNNEFIYNFLFQKKLEAQIASSALISFHRVIQSAIVSKEPVSPNRILITFVSGLLSILIGILIVFRRKLINGKVIGKSDVEKLTATPIISAIRDAKIIDTAQYNDLAARLIAKSQDENITILITSSIREEGKTHICTELKKAYISLGYSVAFLHFNPYNTDNKGDMCIDDMVLSNLDEINFENYSTSIDICYSNGNRFTINTIAHKNFKAVLDRIKAAFNIVLIDTPGSVISPDATALLTEVDLGLYIIRSKYSKAQYISNVDFIQEESGFNKMYIVLNGMHITTNYTGTFNGSRLNYNDKPKGIINIAKHYYKVYLK